MFDLSRIHSLFPWSFRAVAGLGLMSSVAYAVSSGPNTLSCRPMEHFAAINLQAFGVPAIALLLVVSLWNRCLATILAGAKELRPASHPAGLLGALESDPGACALCFGTGFLWISILHSSLNEPEFWWLDLGATAWPLTWAAVCGPWFVKKYWTKERSGRCIINRILLLVITLLGVAGWVYQLLPLAGL